MPARDAVVDEADRDALSAPEGAPFAPRLDFPADLAEGDRSLLVNAARTLAAGFLGSELGVLAREAKRRRVEFPFLLALEDPAGAERPLVLSGAMDLVFEAGSGADGRCVIVDFKTDKDSLKGKKIGAQRATIAGKWLADNLGKLVDVRFYDTQENAYLDLASGRLDGILADTFVQWEWLKSDAGQNFEFKGEPVFDNDKIGIAVRKGDPLRERLNQALKEIVADGTYEKINAKYFPFSIY